MPKEDEHHKRSRLSSPWLVGIGSPLIVLGLSAAAQPVREWVSNLTFEVWLAVTIGLIFVVQIATTLYFYLTIKRMKAIIHYCHKSVEGLIDALPEVQTEYERDLAELREVFTKRLDEFEVQARQLIKRLK